MKRPSVFSFSTQKFCIFGITTALLLWAPANCFAGDLVILTSAEDESRNLVLQQSIDAQLMDYDAMSEVMVLTGVSGYDESTVAKAREIQQRTGKRAFLWLNESHFFLYVHVQNDSHLFTRSLPANNGSWEVQCDAIASNVQAMLSPWFQVSVAESYPVLPVEASRKTDGDMAEKRDSDDDLKSRKQEASHRVRPGFGAAYVTSLMSTNNLWSNGATTLFNLQLKSRILLSTGLGFLVDNSRSFRMLRFPVRFRMETFWKTPSFSLGIGASVVIDAIRISSDEYAALENVGNVYIGVGASLAVMYHVSPIFSIVLRGGADLYQSSDKYSYNRDMIFYYGHLQGRTLAGIIFWLR